MERKEKFFFKATQEKEGLNNLPPFLPPLAEKFVNILMVDGKKNKSFTLFSRALLFFRKVIKGEREGEKKELIEPRIVTLEKEKQVDKKSSFKPQTARSVLPLPFHSPLSPLSKEKSLYLTNKEKPQQGWESRVTGSEKAKSTFFLLKQAVENVTPTFYLRQKRIAGITRQIPCFLREKKGETTAIRWIIESARKKKRGGNKPFSSCLGEVLIESFQKKGEVRERRDALHKRAETSRGFLRYRWW